jgi:phenylalanyl-tRNA synthetase beta chain
MKISRNWLQQYLDIPLNNDELSHLLTDIGLEVEGMDTVESVPGGLRGLLIGEVLTCVQHPNADRLSLTTVSVGGEPLQIVCGAPNVAQGQKVVVATVGTELYPTEGEPFTIKKGKIRGETSEGMICALDEIGLGSDHSGIIVLPAEAPVGTPAADWYRVENDVVYEIGLTPNRSDATSHLGVARDLLAALRVRQAYTEPLRLPSGYEGSTPNQLPIEVLVEDARACPRYAGVVVDGLQVGESPDWLKNRLRAIGVRPINNVVDITNYVLQEYGQPLHAFDYDAIPGQAIRVKTLAEGTSFQTLDEVERKLYAEDLMICGANSEPLCIAGVFGGLHSGVTESTTRIFLESAHFSAASVRRTSMRHQLRTDAAKIFEKGSDPAIVVSALKRAAQLLQELAGGQVASNWIDLYPTPIERVEVPLSYEYVNRLIGGKPLAAEDIRHILEALDMGLKDATDTGITVQVPTNKVDVTRPADVVEEILRIYGVNRVETDASLRFVPGAGKFPDPRQVGEVLAGQLVARGYREIMSLSLQRADYFEELLPLPAEELVLINNTSNVQLNCMRPSMLFSMLEAAAYNQNRQQDDLKLFEFGKTYRRSGEGFEEASHLALLLSGQTLPESWHQSNPPEVSFYTLKAQAEQLLQRMGLGKLQQSELESDHPIFSFGMRYHQGQEVFLEFGAVRKKILKKVGLKQAVYYADFHWDRLLKSTRKAKQEFAELNKYPSVRRDLALVVEKSVKFADIATVARKAGKKLLRQMDLFDVYENETQLGAGNKSFALRFVFEHPEHTLQDKEIDQVVSDIVQACERQLGARLRN